MSGLKKIVGCGQVLDWNLVVFSKGDLFCFQKGQGGVGLTGSRTAGGLWRLQFLV